MEVQDRERPPLLGCSGELRGEGEPRSWTMKDQLISTRTRCRAGATGTDAVEQHENLFGILFCYILLNLKAQKLLSYTVLLQGVSWEADSGMEIRG